MIQISFPLADCICGRTIRVVCLNTSAEDRIRSSADFQDCLERLPNRSSGLLNHNFHLRQLLVGAPSGGGRSRALHVLRTRCLTELLPADVDLTGLHHLVGAEPVQPRRQFQRREVLSG